MLLVVFGVVFTTDKGQEIWVTALQLDELQAVSVVSEPVVAARAHETDVALEMVRQDAKTGLTLLHRPCPGAPRVQFATSPAVGARGVFVFATEQGIESSKAIVAQVYACRRELVVDTRCDCMSAGGGPLVIGDAVAGLAFGHHHLLQDISFFYDPDCVRQFFGPHGRRFVLEPVAHPAPDCNTCNHHELDPYLVRDGQLLVDQKFWDQDLTSKGRADWQTIARVHGLVLVVEPKMELPHAVEPDSAVSQQLYLAYMSQFDADRWLTHDLVPGSQVIELEYKLVHKLRGLTQTWVLSGRRSSEVELECADQVAALVPACPEQGWFAKTSVSSGKHERPPRPIWSPLDLVCYLTETREHLRQYEDLLAWRRERLCLVLVPWDSSITPRSEFRVFVRDRKIVAISQQQWHSLEASPVPAPGGQLAEKITADMEVNILPLLESELKNFIADVWVDQQTHLIEVNPGGGAFGGGSALFHWIKDAHVFEQAGSVYMRWLVSQ